MHPVLRREKFCELRFESSQFLFAQPCFDPLSFQSCWCSCSVSIPLRSLELRSFMQVERPPQLLFPGESLGSPAQRHTP